MNDRRHQMRRLIVADLNDEFAKIGFDDVQSGLFEHVGEVDLLADHRLAFDDAGGFLLAGDVENDLPGIFGGGGEMNVAAIFLDVGLELIEVVIEVVEGMALDLAGKRSELVRIGKISDGQLPGRCCFSTALLIARLSLSSPAALVLME